MCGQRTLLKTRITDWEYGSCRYGGLSKYGSISWTGSGTFLAEGRVSFPLGVRTHSSQNVALADWTKALFAGSAASCSLGVPRKGMFPIESSTSSVLSSMVIVPRISWPAIASDNTLFGFSVSFWNAGGNGPLVFPGLSFSMTTSATGCCLLVSSFSGGGGCTGGVGTLTGLMARPSMGGLALGHPGWGFSGVNFGSCSRG